MNTLEVKAKEQANEGLLSRWAKRKQAVLQEAKDLQEKKELDEQGRLAGSQKSESHNAEDAALEDAALEEVALLTDEDMPPIELLTADSDFSGFMSPKVSESLRQMALRKLFHGPAFNICDGLDDYDDDYTSFAKLGNIITADIKHRIEMEARKKLEMAVESAEVKDQANVEARVEASKVGNEETASQVEDILGTGEDEPVGKPDSVLVAADIVDKEVFG